MKNLGESLVSGVAFGFLSQAWLGALAFLATPLIVRSMGTQAYGIYALAGLAAGYFSILEFGLGTAATKFTAEALGHGRREQACAVTWTATLLLAGAGLFVVCAAAALADWFVWKFLSVPPALRSVSARTLVIGAASFSLSMLCGPCGGVLRAQGRFAALNKLSAAQGTLQTLSTLGLLFRGFSVTAVLSSIAALQFAGFLAQWLLCLQGLPELLRPRWDRPEARRLLGFGGFATADSLLSPILSNVEKLFLTRATSLAHLTFYSVPFTLVERLALIPSAFSSVLFPSFSFLHDRHGPLSRDLHERGTAYILILYGIFAVFLISMSRPFLDAWMGKDFSERSALILSICAAGGLLNAAARPALNVLLGLGKPRIVFIIHLAETVLYVPLAYSLVRKWGLSGAALAWALRVSADCVLMHAAAASLLRQPPSAFPRIAARALRVLAAPSLVLAGLRLCGTRLLDAPALLGGLVAAALFLAGAWRWGLDQAARTRIAGFAGLER